MGKYRTANGKTVDMAALAAKNEKVRAVGNMKVNARGDTIDAYGRVVKAATKKVNENYSKTVGNRSAQNKRAQTKVAPRNAKTKQELSKEEIQLENELADDEIVEQIKASGKE